MSILAISAQIFADVSLGQIVKAECFTPPPKVDSRVVILRLRQTPFLTDISEEDFFMVVKAGFSAKRKKLRSSLSGGLKMQKADAEQALKAANINPDDRAEMLSLDDWTRLVKVLCYNKK